MFVLYFNSCDLLGYQEESFLLAWYDRESSDPDQATPLSPKSTQTLYELEMPDEPKRCYLYLRDGPDGPPVKESAQSASTGQVVDLATSVTTSPSSYSPNNTSSTWSSTSHYSTKSDTGILNIGDVGVVN